TRVSRDYDKEYSDRLFGLRKRAATGNHEFDRLCADLGIEHRLAPPMRPQTNGMVERFNGRIEDVLQSHRFRSGEDLEQTILRYVRLYNGQLPQSVLKGRTPIDALKDWHRQKPRLFKKRPYNQAGSDSYVWTREGWLYLAVILDLHSRRVIGWAVSNRMKRDLAIRALNMAIAFRAPPKGCIHHTDRGSQYCSHDYQKLLRQHGFKVSMSGKGNCYDNAAVETFFKTIKAELIWRRSWETRRQAEVAIFEYINGFYNPRRRHSALGWKSPVAFERKVA
ncbi:IS3 family transposase, partial [Palleronia rufa]|uniref:IS3 family transposase n=3 Tax=Palleronia rufa TaxID=1530186 RepID=UPI001F430DE5